MSMHNNGGGSNDNTDANNDPNSSPSSYEHQVAQLLVGASSEHVLSASCIADVSGVLRAALLQQQRQEQQVAAALHSMTTSRSGGGNAPAPSAAPGISNDQAQAILLHHEEQLRQTRLLLQHLEQEEINATSLTSISRDGGSRPDPMVLASTAMAAAQAAQEVVMSSYNNISELASVLQGGSMDTRLAITAAATTSARDSGESPGAGEGVAKKALQVQSSTSTSSEDDDKAKNSPPKGLKTEQPSSTSEEEHHGDAKMKDRRQDNDDKAKGDDQDLKQGESQDAQHEQSDDDPGDEQDEAGDEGEEEGEEEGEDAAKQDDHLDDDAYFQDFLSKDDNRIIQETFPLKLYRMLYEVEKKGKGDIVSFLPHGKSFAVHKPRAFVEEIMPRYFTSCRLASFQRQLNLYGFRRINDGRDKGSYSHDFFQKSQRPLCRKMKRQKTRINAKAKAQQRAINRSLGTMASPSHPVLALGSPQLGVGPTLAFPSLSRDSSAIGGSPRGGPASDNYQSMIHALQLQQQSLTDLRSTASLLSGFNTTGSLTGHGLPNAPSASDEMGLALQNAIRRGLVAEANSLARQGTAHLLQPTGLLLNLQHQHQQQQLQQQQQHQQLPLGPGGANQPPTDPQSVLERLRRQLDQLQQNQRRF